MRDQDIPEMLRQAAPKHRIPTLLTIAADRIDALQADVERLSTEKDKQRETAMLMYRGHFKDIAKMRREIDLLRSQVYILENGHVNRPKLNR